jgi:hypothetical protein
MNLNKKWAFIALLIWPIFYGCSSYHRKIVNYSTDLKYGKYDRAIRDIEKNKFFKKRRNQLLLNMELGRLYMLNNQPEKSNQYLNSADALLESNFKNVGDVAIGNLVNPMMETYRGEEFERWMVNYCKAINYLKQGNMEAALVEVRRMTLAANRLKDKFKDKTSRYSRDPFLFNMQGLIYEAAGDWNNAFIAYRNAVDVYLNASDPYYGVSMPPQLKQDLFYAAYKMGFTDELSRYEKILGQNLNMDARSERELVLLIEEGTAPVKEASNIFLSNAGGGGYYQYRDSRGQLIDVPFNNAYYGIPSDKLNEFRSLRIALPVYRASYGKTESPRISYGGKEVTASLAEDLNTLSMMVLDQRYLEEIAKAMARFITKKLAEVGAQKAVESTAENKNKKSEKDNTSEEQKKKNQEKAENLGMLAGLIVNMYSTLSEQADTRCWMSMPAYIHYARIPLTNDLQSVDILHRGRKNTVSLDNIKGVQIKQIQLNR